MLCSILMRRLLRSQSSVGRSMTVIICGGPVRSSVCAKGAYSDWNFGSRTGGRFHGLHDHAQPSLHAGTRGLLPLFQPWPVCPRSPVRAPGPGRFPAAEITGSSFLNFGSGRDAISAVSKSGCQASSQPGGKASGGGGTSASSHSGSATSVSPIDAGRRPYKPVGEFGHLGCGSPAGTGVGFDNGSNAPAREEAGRQSHPQRL